MNDVKHTIDGGAAIATVGAFLHYMPEIAALFSVIWYVIRIVEWAKSKREKGNPS